MKKWEFYVSQNGWEYAGKVIITANKVEATWSDKTNQSRESGENEIGDTLIADGIKIQFDEALSEVKL